MSSDVEFFEFCDALPILTPLPTECDDDDDADATRTLPTHIRDAMTQDALAYLRATTRARPKKRSRWTPETTTRANLFAEFDRDSMFRRYVRWMGPKCRCNRCPPCLKWWTTGTGPEWYNKACDLDHECVWRVKIVRGALDSVLSAC